MIWLLDGNVLIALTTADHVDHERAHRWITEESPRFATCPMTQGTLLRFYLRFSKDESVQSAWRVLRASPRHPSRTSSG